MWSAFGSMPFVFIAYFWGVLHRWLEVPLSNLMLPFATYCGWILLLSVSLYAAFNLGPGKRGSWLGFYAVASFHMALSSALIVYFGRKLGLMTFNTAKSLYSTIVWATPLIFVVVLLVDRTLLKRSADR
jgi:hypothetical protein